MFGYWSNHIKERQVIFIIVEGRFHPMLNDVQDSVMWLWLMSSKMDFITIISHRARDGSFILFREDTWGHQVPTLSALMVKKLIGGER